MPTTRYLNKRGDRIPSVTQILDHVWAKPGLVAWANREGLNGRSHTVARDAAARAGTLAHEIILSKIGGPEPEVDKYARGTVSEARVSAHHARDWMERHKWEPIMVEESLVHEKLGYGGTPDWYGRLDGVLTVLDIKTGRKWPEHAIQLAGYAELLTAQKPAHAVDAVVALYCPRKLSGKAQDIRWEGEKIDLIAKAWKNCLTMYELRMIIG